MSKIVLINEKSNVLEWELNVENIEAHRDEIDFLGSVSVVALDEDGDILHEREFTKCDVADGLYDALKEISGMLNKYDDECDVIKVSYQFHNKRVAN